MFEPFGFIKHQYLINMLTRLDLSDKTIVDLGSGKPAFSDALVCKKKVKIDLRRESEPDIVNDFSQGIPLSMNSVDICIAIEVIEHLYFSRLFISEIRRILKPNGYLFLTCPNICCLKYRISFLFGHLPALAAKADMFYIGGRPGHIRDYNFKEMEKLLRLYNFRIIYKQTDGISICSKTVVPSLFIPITFGDSLIIMAKKY